MHPNSNFPKVGILGSGLYTPKHKISNEELVQSFNGFVDSLKKAGKPAPEYSSAEFIVKASGIKSRYVMDREGILDIERMCPNGLERREDEPSLQCEMAVSAAKQALANAGCGVEDIGAVLVACSNMPRPYPALAIEIQSALQVDGFAYDLNVACASAAFGVQAAYQQVCLNPDKAVLVVSPEICSAHLNFRDRDSHFIFGDACTALVIGQTTGKGFEIVSTQLKTQYSNNIRNNFGFLNRADPKFFSDDEKLFRQNGRKVFKDVVTLASKHLLQHLEKAGLAPLELKRIWLHQANLNLNQMIAKAVFQSDLEERMAPIILDEYANTSSAGSVIAFHRHHADLHAGDYAMLSAFGAGYSVGSILLRKV